MAKRVKKKELKGDKLVEEGTRFLFYLAKYKVKTGWIAGGILIICIGVVYFHRATQIRQEKARFEEREAITIYGAGNIREAFTRFEDISHLYPKTTSGISSLYWLANIYYLQGKYQEAREFFQKYLEKGKDPILLQGALLGLGDTYLQEGNYFQASQKYEELVNQFPSSSLIPKALLQSIKCYQVLNQLDNTKRALHTLSESYPTSFYTQKSQSLIINLM